MNGRIAIGVAVGCLVLLGCDSGRQPAASSGNQDAADAPTVANDTAAAISDEAAVVADLRGDPHGGRSMTGDLPAGHAPVGSQAPQIPPPTAADIGARIAFDPPEGWESQPPSNPMRQAQYSLPPAEGDDEPGEVVIFAGIGGGAQANIDRWIAQFSGQDGLPAAPTHVEEFDVSGWTVSLVESAGTYSSAMMPGMGGERKPGYRLIGAVIEAGDSPWYVKATGPAATIDQHREAIHAFIRTARPAP